MAFADRLLTLGFSSYQNYLKSEHWLAFRSKFTGRPCQGCDSLVRVALHHLTYERLGCELETDVMPLCWACHESIHLVSKATNGGIGKKRTLSVLCQLQAGETIAQIVAKVQTKRLSKKVARRIDVRDNHKVLAIYNKVLTIKDYVPPLWYKGYETRRDRKVRKRREQQMSPRLNQSPCWQDPEQQSKRLHQESVEQSELDAIDNAPG